MNLLIYKIESLFIHLWPIQPLKYRYIPIMEDKVYDFITLGNGVIKMANQIPESDRFDQLNNMIQDVSQRSVFIGYVWSIMVINSKTNPDGVTLALVEIYLKRFLEMIRKTFGHFGPDSDLSPYWKSGNKWLAKLYLDSGKKELAKPYLDRAIHQQSYSTLDMIDPSVSTLRTALTWKKIIYPNTIKDQLKRRRIECQLSRKIYYMDSLTIYELRNLVELTEPYLANKEYKRIHRMASLTLTSVDSNDLDDFVFVDWKDQRQDMKRVMTDRSLNVKDRRMNVRDQSPNVRDQSPNVRDQSPNVRDRSPKPPRFVKATKTAVKDSGPISKRISNPKGRQNLSMKKRLIT